MENIEQVLLNRSMCEMYARHTAQRIVQEKIWGEARITLCDLAMAGVAWDCPELVALARFCNADPSPNGVFNAAWGLWEEQPATPYLGTVMLETYRAAKSPALLPPTKADFKLLSQHPSRDVREYAIRNAALVYTLETLPF